MNLPESLHLTLTLHSLNFNLFHVGYGLPPKISFCSSDCPFHARAPLLLHHSKHKHLMHFHDMLEQSMMAKFTMVHLSICCHFWDGGAATTCASTTATAIAVAIAIAIIGIGNDSRRHRPSPSFTPTRHHLHRHQSSSHPIPSHPYPFGCSAYRFGCSPDGYGAPRHTLQGI